MKDSLEKFLQGKAEERETRQLEELLSRDTVAEQLLEATSEDSLLIALRAEPRLPEDADAIRQMTEQLEKLIPRPEISAQEIRDLLEPADEPHLLGRVGKYQVTQYLASGGMGLVFRANDSQLNREVCLKLLHPIRARGSEARTRFERESRAIARLNCERIMPILDIDIHRDLPFLVMPLLEGASLRTLLLREGQLPAGRAVRLATQIAEGLDFAHQMGVLHRDIKPDNLWVTPSDDIKLLDFGLARTSEEPTPITHEGTVLGTPSYMSPEQVTGKPLDGRSDLFSLGVVLVEMLTGQSPFRRNNLFSTLMSVASDEVKFEEIDPSSNISPPLREMILKLLQKNPDLRPGNAGEAVALLKHLGGNQAPDFSGSTQNRDSAEKGSGAGWRSWSRTIAAAVGGFALCLGALAIWQLNDKGTLVVKTNDPKVEVKIAGEKVTVVDPLTSRTFEIRIGETPLPSGVYQLEMSEANRELTFSSQTIAIRRGEQTIVTVELKPSTGLPDSPSSFQLSQDAYRKREDGLGLLANELEEQKIIHFANVGNLQWAVDDSIVNSIGQVAFGFQSPMSAFTDNPSNATFETIVPVSRTGDTISFEFSEAQAEAAKTKVFRYQLERNEIGKFRTYELIKQNRTSKKADKADSWIPALEPVPADQIVDKSFDPDVRDRFAEILVKLPALPLEKHLSKSRFSDTAVVKNPRELKGLSAWSLDVAPEIENWEPNSDNSLFARVDDQVWIVDTKGTPKIVLPSPGRLFHVKFDPNHPNLIATSSLTSEDRIEGYFGSESEITYQIQVWRLSPEGAELISDFPSSGYEFLWDHGYRLIHDWQGNLVAHRLDTDKSHVLIKSHDNGLSQGSISPGGRFLATGNRNGATLVNIYDLHRGAIVSTIRLGGKIQWRSDDAALAIMGDHDEFLEIWRTDQPEFLRRVEFEKPGFKASRPAMEANFSRVAQITKDGDLKIRSLASQRESNAKMPSFNRNSDFQLSWKTDGGLRISNDEMAFNWKATDSEVHGTLTLGEPDPKRMESSKTPTKENPRVLAVRDSSLFMDLGQGRVHEYELADLGRKETLPVKSFDEQQFETMSPDGRFAVQVHSERGSSTADIELLDLETGRQESLGTFWATLENAGEIKTPVNNFLEIQWSLDGRYLLLAGRSAGYSPKLFLTIWDTKDELTSVSFDTSMMEEEGFFSNGQRKVISALAYRDGFLIKVRSSAKGDFDINWVQPGIGESTVLDFSAFKLEKAHFQQAAGDYLFISTPGEVESETLWHRGKIENGKFVLDSTVVAGIDDQFDVSVDGRFFYSLRFMQNLGKSIVGRWPEKNNILKIQNIEPIAAWRNRDPQDVPVWHQNGRYMAIPSLQTRGMFILELESGKWSRPALNLVYNDAPIHSTNFGWLVNVQDRFAAISDSGEMLGAFCYFADLKNDEEIEGLDSNPLIEGRWILADGSTLKDESHLQLQFQYRRGNQIAVESLADYLANPENLRLPEFDSLPFDLK